MEIKDSNNDNKKFSWQEGCCFPCWVQSGRGNFAALCGQEVTEKYSGSFVPGT